MARHRTRRAGASHTHISLRVAQVDKACRARAPSLATSLVYGPMSTSYTRVDVNVLNKAVDGCGPIMVTWVDMPRLVHWGKPIHPRGVGQERWALSTLSPCSLCILYPWVCVRVSRMGRSSRSCTMQYIDTVGPAVHLRGPMSVMYAIFVINAVMHTGDTCATVTYHSPSESSALHTYW